MREVIKVDIKDTAFGLQLAQYIVFQMGAKAYELYDKLFHDDRFVYFAENPFINHINRGEFYSHCFVRTKEDLDLFFEKEKLCEQNGLLLVDNEPLSDNTKQFMEEIISNAGRAISYDGGESWYRIDGIRFWRGGAFVATIINKETCQIGNVTSIRAIASPDKTFKLRDHVLDDKTNEDYVEDYVEEGSNIFKLEEERKKNEKKGFLSFLKKE